MKNENLVEKEVEGEGRESQVNLLYDSKRYEEVKIPRSGDTA